MSAYTNQAATAAATKTLTNISSFIVIKKKKKMKIFFFSLILLFIKLVRVMMAFCRYEANNVSGLVVVRQSCYKAINH